MVSVDVSAEEHAPILPRHEEEPGRRVQQAAEASVTSRHPGPSSLYAIIVPQAQKVFEVRSEEVWGCSGSGGGATAAAWVCSSSVTAAPAWARAFWTLASCWRRASAESSTKLRFLRRWASSEILTRACQAPSSPSWVTLIEVPLTSSSRSTLSLFLAMMVLLSDVGRVQHGRGGGLEQVLEQLQDVVEALLGLAVEDQDLGTDVVQDYQPGMPAPG